MTDEVKPAVKFKPCPICRQPANQQWFVNRDATHVLGCDRCASPIIYREIRTELQKAHAGRGPLAGRLTDLSRATHAGAISELGDVQQVLADLQEFLDEESL